jgi:hypothetical protein
MTDEKIEQLRKQQKELLSEMDAVAREFIAATAQQLSAQLIPVTKRICQPQKEVNKALGQAGLEKGVADVKTLAAKMPLICHECFYRDTVWIHLHWKKESKHKQDPRKIFPWAPGKRDTNQNYGWSFIDAIDYLGAILTATGYSTNTAAGYDGYDVAHSSLYRDFTWSTDMERLQDRYDDFEKELWKSQRKIEDLTSRKPFQPSQDFWDSVQ